MDYNKQRFVSRNELAALIAKIEAWASGQVRERTLVVTGERGVGKSWLIRGVEEHLKSGQIKHLEPFALDLSAYARFDPTIAVFDALKKLLSVVSAEPQETDLGATPAEVSRRVMTQVNRFLERHKLVVILNHVYEADWKLLESIEDYLLAPLAIHPNVLIILVGRGRPYPWHTPELRPRPEYIEVKKFDLPQTETQLTLAGSTKNADQIYEQSEGNALANRLLADENVPQAIQSYLNDLLYPISEAEQQELRANLEALCVLRVFDEDHIPFLLAAYHDEGAFLKWSYADARQVRERLVRSKLAYWNPERNGYMIDPVIRRLIEINLKQSSLKGKEVWRRLHQAAIALYKKWMTDYKELSETWQMEKEYHENILNQQDLPDQNPS
jgi:hypothetical protein